MATQAIPGYGVDALLRRLADERVPVTRDGEAALSAFLAGADEQAYRHSDALRRDPGNGQSTEFLASYDRALLTIFDHIRQARYVTINEEIIRRIREFFCPGFPPIC